MEGSQQVSETVPVIAYQVPHASSAAEVRCAGSYDYGKRGCSRLLLKVYRPTVGDLGLYCSRCKEHHRVSMDFSTGQPRVGPAASLSKAS